MNKKCVLAICHLVLAASFGAGCTSVSADLATASAGPNVDLLQPGTSTLRDAIVELGPIAAEADMGDGTKLYQWMYVGIRNGRRVGVHVAILFNARGVMQSLQSRSEIPY